MQTINIQNNPPHHSGQHTNSSPLHPSPHLTKHKPHKTPYTQHAHPKKNKASPPMPRNNSSKTQPHPHARPPMSSFRTPLFSLKSRQHFFKQAHHRLECHPQNMKSPNAPTSHKNASLSPQVTQGKQLTPLSSPFQDSKQKACTLHQNHVSTPPHHAHTHQQLPLHPLTTPHKTQTSQKPLHATRLPLKKTKPLPPCRATIPAKPNRIPTHAPPCLLLGLLSFP